MRWAGLARSFEVDRDFHDGIVARFHEDRGYVPDEELATDGEHAKTAVNAPATRPSREKGLFAKRSAPLAMMPASPVKTSAEPLHVLNGHRSLVRVRRFETGAGQTGRLPQDNDSFHSPKPRFNYRRTRENRKGKIPRRQMVAGVHRVNYTGEAR